LNDPVNDRWDSKFPRASIPFRDFLSPYWAWFIPPFTNALKKFLPVFPNPRSRRINRHPIDSRCSVVTLDLLVSPVVPFQYAFQQVSCTASFFAFPRAGALRSYILFAFHAIPLQVALAVFCFPPISLLPAFTQNLRLFSPSRKKTSVLWPLLTSHDKLYSVFRILHVRESSPAKNDHLHPI
jgi:hypothetical protein